MTNISTVTQQKLLSSTTNNTARIQALKDRALNIDPNNNFPVSRERAMSALTDFNDRITTLSEFESILNDCQAAIDNPLEHGDWVVMKPGVFHWRWQTMGYGYVNDTRKTEGRSKDVFKPYRTTDEQLHQTLREAKKHELNTHSKTRLIEDGYLRNL